MHEKDSVRAGPLPSSMPPDEPPDSQPRLDDDQLSASRLRAAPPTVALLVEDPAVRIRLVAAMQRLGLLPVGESSVGDAVVVIIDAPGSSKEAVASVRARARTDAAIVVLLPATVESSEIHAAYEAGAVLCAARPPDEEQLVAVLGSAVHLHSAKAHADDLMRKLESQSHLASIGRVTANFTHELSNPLGVIAANAEYLADRLEQLSKSREHLAEVIAQNGSRASLEAARRHLAQTARDGGETREALADIGVAVERMTGILSMARGATRNGYGGRVEPVDLAAIVHDVRRWAAADLVGVEVEELVDEPVAAMADAHLLGQILLNLVTNAAHAAMQLASPRVRLHVYATPEGAIVSVRDNGPGIASDIRDRIFEPFFTTRRTKGGTGLGLALCREYARQIGARLTFWTAAGRGTCFRVRMPRA
jgi:signal transduction histidine kinase